MFGFSKHCKVCGVEVERKTALKRFGRYFCSNKHAQAFVAKKEELERQRQEEQRKYQGRRGGCC